MPLEKALAAVLNDSNRFGQIFIQRTSSGGFVLCQRDDENARDLEILRKSDGGCLRTILWKRDTHGAIPSTKLPSEKFDPGHDQAGRGENAIPLLCQEACNLLVGECRKAVKGEIDE